MIKQGTTTKIPKGFSKVMRGNSLVWENAKKISFNVAENVHIYSGGFYVPSNVVAEIKGKRLISIKVEGYKDIDEQYIKGMSSSGFLAMKTRFYEFLEPQTGIPKGTKITITYK
jgi:hypothetical protein